jgi:hypothetical protein
MGALRGNDRKQQRHWLVVPKACPWRERVNAAEGLGGGGSCWLLCVVVVFCVVACDRVLILPIL